MMAESTPHSFAYDSDDGDQGKGQRKRSVCILLDEGEVNKENRPSPSKHPSSAAGWQEGLYLKRGGGSGVRLTVREQEQISELRKQLARKSETEQNSAPSDARTSELATEVNNNAARLRRINQLGRRTSTPLRELFQQSLAAAAGGTTADITPPHGEDGAALSSITSQESATASEQHHPATRILRTGKRKSDVDTVLERLAASGENSPSKRRRTSLIPTDPDQRTSHATMSLDEAKDDNDDQYKDENELAAVDMSVSIMDVSCSADTLKEHSLQQDLPPSLALFDSLSSSTSVDTRLDKRESFLRRTFSVKKMKAGTFTANSDPRLSFLRLLTEQDFALITALLEVGNEDLAMHIITIMNNTGHTLHLLKILLSRELSSTVSEGTLFRGVSISTRLVSHYMRTQGKEYLKSTLSHFFEMLVSQDVRLEVDPNRAVDNSVSAIESNCAELIYLCQSLLRSLFASSANVPSSLKDLFAFLQAEVVQRFPLMKDKVVGGFYFLRFLCPALVSPEQWELIQGTVSSPLRRTLVLVSKVLQNLANELEFGDKEAYMRPINAFIQDTITSMKEFLSGIAQSTTGARIAPASDPSVMWADDGFVSSLFALYDEASRHMGTLQAQLRASGQEALAEELEAIARMLPSSREEQLKLAKKRSRKLKKREDIKQVRKSERRPRRSLSDTELDGVEPTVRKKDNAGRRQLNRLLSTSKKLLPKFATEQQDSESSLHDTSNGDSMLHSSGVVTPRKFLKAKRKAADSALV